MIAHGTNFKGRSDVPLILHCHIPKTAGITVSDGFKRSFELCHFHHYHPDPHYILTREILQNLLEINPGLLSISSHHLRSFPLSVSGRPTFLVTFLRKPENAFISHLRFVQRQFLFMSAEVKRVWPKDTPSLPLRELARQYLDLVTAYEDFSPQTRFFCNPAGMLACGFSDGHQYGLDSYEFALSVLGGFHFVGIVEEMKKSLEVLTDRLLQLGIRIHFKFDLKLNACRKNSRPAWLTPDDEVGQRVLDSSRSDGLLHDYFLDELLRAHADLRKRRWLGFKPAAADVKDALSDGWRDATRSLVNSAHLYLSKRNDHIDQLVLTPPCSDLLELRAAQAVSEQAQVAQTVR
jgi:hypothetical protein